VEEGEILSCPECEAELEVVQTHPVHVNVISEDDEDEDAEAGKDDEAEGGDAKGDDALLDEEEEEVE